MQACVRLDDKLCLGQFAVEQGPRQGSVLALLLFNILFAAFINVAYTRFEVDKDTIDALVHLRKNRGVAGNNQRKSQSWRHHFGACFTLTTPELYRSHPSRRGKQRG